MCGGNIPENTSTFNEVVYSRYESCPFPNSRERPRWGSTPVASHRPANAPNAGPMRIRNSGPSHRKGMALVSSPQEVAFPSGLSATGT
jgi:hypothetical protein